nr:hypothetical protein [uncultured Carboxylicivirga sp.]
MIYFKGIVDESQAKLRYGELAKQLHPDAGGTASEFQKMQEEYNATLLHLQKQKNTTYSQTQTSLEDELLKDLGRLAKILIKKQVPQSYLKQKIRMTDSSLKKDILEGVVNLLNGL